MQQIEFNLLSKDDQLETLSKTGFVIGTRSDKKHSYVFYCLDEFFVEVKLEKDIPKHIQSLSNTQQLSLYSNGIQLKIAS